MSGTLPEPMISDSPPSSSPKMSSSTPQKFEILRSILKRLASAVILNDLKSISICTKTFGLLLNKTTLVDTQELMVLIPLDNAVPSDPNICSKYGISQKRLSLFKEHIEIQVFVSLLYIEKLLSERNNYDYAKKEILLASQKLISKIKDTNRRSLDMLNAKSYYVYSRACEINGQLTQRRNEFFTGYRNACLRNDLISKATILNILLRSFILEKQYIQAKNLISKTDYPESISGTQYARFLYYNGRIKAIQLEYTEAQSLLTLAFRKSPQTKAHGFRVEILKLLTIVELLVGELPSRRTFSQTEFKTELYPYFQIVQAVRTGNIKLFEEVIKQNESYFASDGNLLIINRLRQNVIKFGLRKIFLSYSKISLVDICSKINLNSSNEAELVVAKAIREGVIEAIINHEEGTVEMKKIVDIYSSNLPLQEFTKRIKYCLDLHNSAENALEFKKKPEKEVKIPDKTDRTNKESLLKIAFGDII